MRLVLLATLPGVVALTVFFGFGDDLLGAAPTTELASVVCAKPVK